MHQVREMVNAVFYVIKSGCQWRMLPENFPLFQAVFAFYSRFRNKETSKSCCDFEKNIAEVGNPCKRMDC
ncbi:MAG: transposase [Holosporaceae bacterium]|nr:transposase [Holosporaceae bacterium]